MFVTVLKNVACEGPGLLGWFMEKNSIAFQEVNLFAREKIPPVKEAGALVVLGGPMNVYEEEKFPFLAEEDKAIKEAIQRKTPFLGICLGGQLLAKALNARVTKNPVKEIGAFEIELTADGQKNDLFNGLEKAINVFQWHGDTFAIPEEARKLASSQLCKNQCFSFGKNAFAMQFHLELTKEMLKEWIDEYKDELASLAISRNKLIKEFSENERAMNANAQTVFDNFFKTAQLFEG